MLRIRIGEGRNDVGTILCLGAHCDDIEIGCGGTVLKLLEGCTGVNVKWIVFSGTDIREREARTSAGQFLKSAADWQVTVKRFRNGYFPFIQADIKDYFEELKEEIAPDLIFSHYGHDLHQDHRAISELTWNTFRDHFILEYEIPKYDGGLGSPNFFITLEERHRQAKIDSLMSCFESETEKRWFSADTFSGLSRIRGIECNSPSGFAEAFYCRKAVL